eukprot:1172554-Prorocentrum_minimum.AAC.2
MGTSFTSRNGQRLGLRHFPNQSTCPSSSRGLARLRVCDTCESQLDTLALMCRYSATYVFWGAAPTTAPTATPTAAPTATPTTAAPTASPTTSSPTVYTELLPHLTTTPPGALSVCVCVGKGGDLLVAG